jgi:hypothetical protein
VSNRSCYRSYWGVVTSGLAKTAQLLFGYLALFVLGLRLLLRTSGAKKVKMTCAGGGGGNKVPRPENPHLILEVILSNPTLTFRFESSKF